MTRSSATLTLFAEPSITPRRPSIFALSILAHMAVAGVAYFGITHLPCIEEAQMTRYSVRQLDLHAVLSPPQTPAALDPNFPNLPRQLREENKIDYPGKDVIARMSRGVSPDMADAMRAFLQSATGWQTLIQPEFRTHIPLAEQVSLPSVMIWTPELMKSRRIVPPIVHPPESANENPSFDRPNDEIRTGKLAVASNDLSAHMKALPSGTTSPLETRVPKAVQMAPATVSAPPDQPTPTAVLSISDVRVNDGTMFLPPINEVAESGGGPHAGSAAAAGGSGSAWSKASAEHDDAEDVTMDGRRLSTEHIALARNGKFNIVVVGSSLAEEYPETPEIWADRIAYTAYLHVGLKKNWILQYSATRATDASAAGNVAHMEAPWPYDITRPNLMARDVNADALMVHGILNQAGRLESLGIAFPSGFRYASFVLRALRQWQFRPAMKNGQATAVEVLLIIPEELD